MSDITVIGSNMIDLITYLDRMPVEGETVSAPDFEMGFGGKGANQAVAASRLGSDVAMITMVGHDNFGKQQLANFQKVGIDTSCIGVGNSNSGAAPIFVDPSSDNRIIVIKGANNELTPEVLDSYKEQIKNSKLIVLQQEIPLETNYHAIDLAEEFGVPVLLNPAPANNDLNLKYVSKVEFFSPNETELSTLTGLSTSNLDEIKTAAKFLVKEGVGNIIVTLGSKGALWVNKDHEEIIPGKKVKAIDTTGAGDSFIGSFAHYFTEGESIPEALKHANEYAAVTVTKKGTQKSYPTKDELKELVEA
ncbi:ribokinase [Companilactobacillus mindensis DSM 14500]|uniref:Deoxyribokinase n=1 Tax=Companilactobacillus mindensis DSM 14500 TaxID=1423770 RepID=A0A0R1QP99_9LACO|nr:ribokinase [Companilactobacillus mindensis]KRL44021.1 ribokinase [Companilactobacillus mindensis DSM 14500]GEO78930.1 ribokinase [Companilactobacillus mindensis]